MASAMRDFLIPLNSGGCPWPCLDSPHRTLVTCHPLCPSAWGGGSPGSPVALGCRNSWPYWGQQIRTGKGCAVLEKPESWGAGQWEAERMQSGCCGTEMCFQMAFQTNRPDVGTYLPVWEKTVFSKLAMLGLTFTYREKLPI